MHTCAATVPPKPAHLPFHHKDSSIEQPKGLYRALCAHPRIRQPSAAVTLLSVCPSVHPSYF